ncbi:MAG: DNA repair exonuclease [Oscillospiraceae bacterium]|nr:DNA repair exonuclease [Oscillospiraceae bacterium]
MVRILHAADLHLDSAFAALEEDQARQRRQESRRLVERMVDYANERQVELMLLAGDLFDSDDVFAQTGETLALALSRFRGQAVIAPGNHDYYDPNGAYGRILWPGNVHVFTRGTLERLDFPALGCSVYGAAFTAPTAEDGSVLDGFTAPEDDRVHILLLHGDVGVKNSVYRPLTAQQLERTGVDYAALGHQHAFSGVCRAGSVSYAYPGCPEGRGFDETGDKGVLYGTVERGSAALQFVPMARRRYEVLTADVSDAAPEEAVLRALPENTQDDIYRLILTGETAEPVRPEQLRRALEDRFYALELRDETRIRQDIWEKCGDDSLRGLFLAELRKRYDGADETERRRIEQAARFGLAAMDNREM